LCYHIKLDSTKILNNVSVCYSFALAKYSLIKLIFYSKSCRYNAVAPCLGRHFLQSLSHHILGFTFIINHNAKTSSITHDG